MYTSQSRKPCFDSLYKLSQTWRPGFKGWMVLVSNGRQGLDKVSADTKLSDGAVFAVDDGRKELIIEYPRTGYYHQQEQFRIV